MHKSAYSISSPEYRADVLVNMQFDREFRFKNPSLPKDTLQKDPFIEFDAKQGRFYLARSTRVYSKRITIAYDVFVHGKKRDSTIDGASPEELEAMVEAQFESGTLLEVLTVVKECRPIFYLLAHPDRFYATGARREAPYDAYRMSALVLDAVKKQRRSA